MFHQDLALVFFCLSQNFVVVQEDTPAEDLVVRSSALLQLEFLWKMNAPLSFAILAYNQLNWVSNGRKFEFENIFLHLRLAITLWYLTYELSEFITATIVLSLVILRLVILLSCWLWYRVVDTATSRWIFFFVARLRWLHFFLSTLRTVFWASTSLMRVIFLVWVFICLVGLHQITSATMFWLLVIFSVAFCLQIWVT